jgi:hypothetical protein
VGVAAESAFDPDADSDAMPEDVIAALERELELDAKVGHDG